jgi:ubiquinone/menaquinone biosynthesis C-methylase UbiE
MRRTGISYTSDMEDRYTHGQHDHLLAVYETRTAEEAAAFLRPHLEPGMAVVDIGCGPGSITAGLAPWVAPGRVLGVDAASESIDRAHVLYGDVPGLRFTVASAYDLPAANGDFDAAYAHQVLQHLHDPVAALREMGRVLRPGGIVAVRDADYGTMVHWPQEPEIERWLDLYHQVVREHGGEPDAGRRLLAWVDEAGFADATATTVSWTYADPATRKAWAEMWANRLAEGTFRELTLEIGLATEQDLSRLADGWHRWSIDRSAFFAFLNVQVTAIRPA